MHTAAATAPIRTTTGVPVRYVAAGGGAARAAATPGQSRLLRGPWAAYQLTAGSRPFYLLITNRSSSRSPILAEAVTIADNRTKPSDPQHYAACWCGPVVSGRERHPRAPSPGLPHFVLDVERAILP